MEISTPGPPRTITRQSLSPLEYYVDLRTFQDGIPVYKSIFLLYLVECVMATPLRH